ncbi:type II toxin-antitoxin system RelE/ParE family toxin [uncultured Devosia sp.]|uniref:type II toxin-antitoxin system RelE/ParE family toxin n=1 Tax=uncultured Devosia sp. TaxID=211434 RepID=UPI0035CA5337
MLDVQWTDEAVKDLAELLDYIAFDNQGAAERLNRQLDQSIRVACEFPSGFKPGRIAGTREIVAHPNYIVVYRVSEERIEIVSVLHARREYP